MKSDYRVLVTSGPTSIPIDAMRVITNRSTGEMGRLLAAAFLRRGARVTLLEGAVTTTVPCPGKVIRRTFYFFDELKALMQEELRKGVDVVVHAAAVSDFRCAHVLKGKRSSSDQLTLELVPTEKLLNQVKKTVPDVFLAGFKFETRFEDRYILKKAKGLFEQAGCDVILANRQDENGYAAFLVFPDGTTSERVTSKQDIIRLLTHEIYHSGSRRRR